MNTNIEDEKIVLLTQMEAQEVLGKLAILNDTPDLQEDYGITQEQAAALVASVPASGGEFRIPAFALKAVTEEMADAILILRDAASQSVGSPYSHERGMALGIASLATRLEKKFEAVK